MSEDTDDLMDLDLADESDRLDFEDGVRELLQRKGFKGDTQALAGLFAPKPEIPASVPATAPTPNPPAIAADAPSEPPAASVEAPIQFDGRLGGKSSGPIPKHVDRSGGRL